MSYTFTGEDVRRQVTVTVNQSLSAAPAVSAAMVGLVQAEFCGA